MSEPTIDAEEWRAGIDPFLEDAAANYEARNRPWSDRERSIVRRYYRRVPTRILAKRLNRTIGAVQQVGKHMDMGDET